MSSPSASVVNHQQQQQQQQQQRSWWWRQGISRRPIASKTPAAAPVVVIHPDIDPPPKPWPLAQFLAFGLILFFSYLQFLPPTHFRDPSDPFRSWIPFDNSSSSSNSRAPNSTGGGEVGTIHVVSWMDCLDLRMLAVLANSTLSNSRYPERIHFHFFTPEGNEDKVSYYKLKVLFPHSNLDIIGQKEVKEKLKIATSLGENVWPSLHEIAPFIIPSTHPSLSRFIYVSPDIILKGSIEELFGIDLRSYAIAAAEDCSKHLNDYVTFDVLDAIQRSAAKPWVSMKPYEKTACAPDLNVLLISARKMEKDLVEAIVWWSKVLNSGHKWSNQINPAMALALYGKYLVLSTTWKVSDSTPSKTNNSETKVFRFDGPRKICSSEDNHDIQQSNLSNFWEQYIPTMSGSILVN